MGNKIQNTILKIKQIVTQFMSKKSSGQSNSLKTKHSFQVTRYCSINNFIVINTNDPFNLYSSRIPHTRIYSSIIENRDFSANIIEYFDLVFFIFEKKTDNSSINISVKNEIYINDTLTQEDSLINITEDSIYIFSNTLFFKGLENIPSLLTTIYDKEIKIHPLNHIKTHNSELFQKIDDNWALISSIKKDREIINLENIFWIQEIFLHFNWTEELTKVYDKYTNNSINSPEYFQLCRQRYQFTQNTLVTISNEKSESLFYEYIYRNLEKNNLHESIQNSWKEIHSPARENYFSDKLNTNPDEYIALLLFAVQENFYWYPLLFEKINLHLRNKNLLNIVNMLILLKTQLNLYLTKETWTFSSQTDNDNYTHIDIPSLNSDFSIYKNHGKSYTKFNHHSSNIEFKIDKSVVVSYELIHKTILIKPKIFLPPLSILEFNYLSIIVNNITIKVPLLWRQFFVQYNGCRIKFLLKKKRWQISFTINEDIHSLFVAGNTIDLSNKRYFSIYHENNVKGNINSLDIFDKYGLYLEEFSKSIHKFSFKGIGISGNGLIINNFNILKTKSSKNIKIPTNQLYSLFINNYSDRIALKATASKFNSIVFERNASSGIFNSIRDLNPSELRYKLIFLINENLDKTNIKLINNIFYEKLLFYPIIQNISKITLNKENFYIILDHSSKWNIIGNYKGIEIVKFINSELKAILINKDNLKNELSRFFTCI